MLTCWIICELTVELDMPTALALYTWDGGTESLEYSQVYRIIYIGCMNGTIFIGRNPYTVPETMSMSAHLVNLLNRRNEK